MIAITEYQRLLWLILSYLALCRYEIVRNISTGQFKVAKAGKFRLFLYYALWINTLIKVTYLVLAYRKYLPMEVHFLDQMGMWDHFFCFSQLVQETHMWYCESPIFEILHANWKIQEAIYYRLGSPKNVEDAILKNDRRLVKIHSFVVAVSCIGIAVQFLSAPKFAAGIYAVIPADNWFLRAIFCTHEVLYTHHMWIHQAFSIVLCEAYASSYTHILREMTKTLDKLTDLGTRYEDAQGSTGLEKQQREELSLQFKKKYIWKRKLHPKTKCPGTQYDIMTLLEDYQKMMLATDSFNSWCGRLMGGTMASNYIQFVTDVFMIIQLLKEPETDTFAVFFYTIDACEGMLMLFYMLIIISRVYPMSEGFLHALKQYVVFDTPLRSYLLKYQKGLRIITTKLGGYKTRPITVPTGINILINYYITAAMWKRPADRKT